MISDACGQALRGQAYYALTFFAMIYYAAYRWWQKASAGGL